MCVKASGAPLFLFSLETDCFVSKVGLFASRQDHCPHCITQAR